MHLVFLLLLVAASPVSEAGRYGCSVFGSLCAQTEHCDTAVLLGQCTTEIDLRKRDIAENRKSDVHKFVFIRFDLTNCEDCGMSVKADQVVLQLARHVGMERKLFTEIQGSGNVVTFGVGKNGHGMGTNEIANAIENDKDVIGQTIGFVITECGTTDKVAVEFIKSDDEEESGLSFGMIVLLLIVVLASCFVLTIITVSIIALIIKKRSAEKSYISGTYMITPKCSLADEGDLSSYELLARERHEQLAKGGQFGKEVGKSESVNTKKLENESTEKWQEEPVRGHLDLTTGHLILSYLEELCENQDKLTEDWTGLCTYVADGVSTKSGSGEENSAKNRFDDVLPYDHNRVLLDEENNVSDSDYINASNICDVNPRKAIYIATQGPLENTVADFWQMVWEQDCFAIVMLESPGTDRCYQYWPEQGMKVFHAYEVHLSSEHLLWDDYVVRTIFLKNLNTNETRTVTQFHFLAWPSLGIPSQPKSLLQLRRKVRGSFSGQECPIVVHDSGGVGRTGTYILVDIVLNRIQGSKMKEIDLAATVEHLRDQRMQMVKTKDQFEFALKALVEEVRAILDAMPSPTGKYHQFRSDEGEDDL